MSFARDYFSQRAQARWPAEKIRAEQDRLLRETVRHAYDNVPWYRCLFDDALITPDDIRTLADLPRIPITRRLYYRRASLEDRIARGTDLSRCKKANTSGSTGIPLDLYLGPEDLSRQQARWMLMKNSAGLRPWHRKLTVGMIRQVPLRGLMKHRHLQVTADEACDIAIRFRPQIINGYPTQIFLLAQKVAARRDTTIRPRFITCGGETLTPAMRRFIEETFRAPVLDHFGTHEFGMMLGPCPAGPGFRQVSLDHIIEILKPDGTPAASGQTGELICTSLTARAMPFLRYALGDIATAAPARCSCGSAMLHIAAVHGRDTEMAFAADGKQISPMMIAGPWSRHPALLQYRATQRAPDSFLIEMIVTGGTIPDDLERSTRDYFTTLFGAREIELRRVETIPPQPSGKARRFVPLPELTTNLH